MAYLTNEQLKALGFKKIGNNVRVSDSVKIYNAGSIEIGDNSRIDDYCVLSGKISIGRNVHIAVFCNVAGGIGGIEIDDFAGLAYHVNLFSQSDDYSGASMTNPTVPKEFKREKIGSLRLGRHVIIGAGSMVFPDAHVAEGCSVGAMSLITKPTKEWGIYFGVPARCIGERKKDLLVFEQQYLEIYG